MPRIITFEEAIADSAQFKKRHLLLGNGFSIGCRAEIFHYASLYAQADFSAIPEVQQAFNVLGTQDFEIVIRTLEAASKLLPFYAPESAAGTAKMIAHAEALKEILVATIAANHPERPHDIFDDEFWACRRFLSHFLSGDRAGHVFSLNYDLLLYWTLMHDDDPGGEEPLDLSKNDSFGNDEDDPDTDYVVWQGETAAHSANIHFLHGAVHLFDAGSELQKYTWVRKGEPLVDQSRVAIDSGKFPLFVAEGTSAQKKSKIRHHAYLYQCFKVLTANAGIGTHCFFVFGHSLADNDDHILKRLGRGRFRKMYVSLYGDPNSDTNKQIIERAQNLAAQRQERFPLELAFFDAESAHVWGEDEDE